jgi:hypothetical protein
MDLTKFSYLYGKLFFNLNMSTVMKTNEISLVNDSNTTFFKVKFGGQNQQIDANVLINSLLHTTQIVQEVNRYLDSNRKIKIDVKALEKGSFIVGLSLSDISKIGNIFVDVSSSIASIVGMLLGIIELKKHLKGKHPQKVEEKGNERIITAHDGTVFNVHCDTFNVYQNKVVQEALAKNFETINEDSAVEGFSILDGENNTLTSVDRSDFNFMSEMPEEIEYGERDQITNNALLNIIRVSFDDSLTWDFYYSGNKIKAKIKDPDFYKLINEGKARFASGDILDVELNVMQKFDNVANTYYNSAYQVIKINKHI